MISIYKLYSPSNPHLIYIGSTQQSLYNRFGGHMRDTDQFIQGHRNFRSSCRLMMKTDCQIIELEKCEEKDRLQREQIYMIIAKLIYKKNCINQRWAIPLSISFHTNRWTNRKKQESLTEFKKWKSEADKKYREGSHRREKARNDPNKLENNRKRREKARLKKLEAQQLNRSTNNVQTNNF